MARPNYTYRTHREARFARKVAEIECHPGWLYHRRGWDGFAWQIVATLPADHFLVRQAPRPERPDPAMSVLARLRRCLLGHAVAPPSA
jgi:hypothetical protein